jgi:E3 SUMO-protein ligase PIAS1
LENTPKSVESVTIDVDGRWSLAIEASNPPMPDTDDEHDDHDDIIEISDNRVMGIQSDITPSVSPIAQSSREESFIPRGSISSKRPISQVIDLTLSDDDDDEPLRPAKRINSFLTPSSTNSDSRGGLVGFEAVVFDGLSGPSRSPVGNQDTFLNKFGR